MKLEWKTCWKAGITLLLLYMCITLWPKVASIISTLFSAAAPLFIACVLAYVLNLIMNGYERIYAPNHTGAFVIKSRRPVCLILAFLTLLAIIALVVGIVLPELVSGLGLIVAQLPKGLEFIANHVDNIPFLPESIVALLTERDWGGLVNQLITTVSDSFEQVADVTIKTVSSVFSGVITAFLAIIFSAYILGTKERLSRQFHALLSHFMPPRWHDRFFYVLDVLHTSFRGYIIGQCTEAVILGVLCIVGMWIFKFPYATTIGTLIAFTALIPIAGAYIGAIVGALLILPVAPIKALLFLVFILILQQLEGNIIYPKVVGNSIGLPGLWVLAAVTIGGSLFGIPGMFLGVPLVAAIYRILREHVEGTSILVDHRKTKARKAPKPQAAPESPPEAPSEETPAQDPPSTG